MSSRVGSHWLWEGLQKIVNTWNGCYIKSHWVPFTMSVPWVQNSWISNWSWQQISHNKFVQSSKKVFVKTDYLVYPFSFIIAEFRALGLSLGFLFMQLEIFLLRFLNFFCLTQPKEQISNHKLGGKCI